MTPAKVMGSAGGLYQNEMKFIWIAHSVISHGFSCFSCGVLRWPMPYQHLPRASESSSGRKPLGKVTCAVTGIILRQTPKPIHSQTPRLRGHRLSMVQLRCQNCPILPLGKTTVTESISPKTWKCRFFPILSQTGLLFERFQELPRSTAQCVGFPDPMQEWWRTVPGSSWAKSYDSILRRVSPWVLGIPRPQTIYSEHIRTIYNPSVEGCNFVSSGSRLYGARFQSIV